MNLFVSLKELHTKDGNLFDRDISSGRIFIADYRNGIMPLENFGKPMFSTLIST